MTPLVSILVPAYNAGPWLRETLRSALAQTHPHIEIIVVDDGSRDDTLAIAREVAANHPSVRVFAQSNAGASAARNHAIRVSTGDYLQFLDADDLLDSEKIALQIARSDNGRIPLLSGSWGRFLDDITTTRWDVSPLLHDLNAVDFAQGYFTSNSMMHPSAWLVRRDIATAAGPWDERLSLNDDGEYFFRVIIAAGHIVHCAAARSYYRTGHASSLSWQTSRKHMESAFLAAQLTAENGLKLSPTLRTATADLWLKFAFDHYPAAPDLVVKAEQEAARLGGGKIKPEGGRAFRFLRPLIGWKLARRLQQLTHRHPVIRPS